MIFLNFMRYSCLLFYFLVKWAGNYIVTKLEWPELKHTYNKKEHRVQNMVKLLYLISVIYLLVRVYARFISAFNVVQNQSDRYRAQGVAHHSTGP